MNLPPIMRVNGVKADIYWMYSTGGRSKSVLVDEKNDCAVRTMAHFLNLDYEKAHALLSAMGRPSKRGIRIKALRAGVASILPVWRVPTGFITVRDALECMTHGRFAVRTRGHIFAVINGLVLDDGLSSLDQRVYEVWTA